MADAIDWQNPFSGILQQVLGGAQSIDQTSAENTQTANTTTGNTNVTQNNTQNQSGSTTTQNTGTQTSSNQQTSSQTGTSTTKSSADTAALQEIFNKQKAGITPEMLAAIFSEGAKKTPGLVSAYANAVGARTDNNSPLAVALTGLQSELTNQAATLNNQMLKDSATTAAQIAELTKQQTTENSGTQTGTNVGQTSTSQQQVMQQIMQLLSGGNTSTNTTQNANQTTNTTGQKNIDQSSEVNTDMLKQLLLGGGGLAALNAILQGTGAGGISGALSSIFGGGSSGAGGSGGLISSGAQALMKLLTGGGNVDSTLWEQGIMPGEWGANDAQNIQDLLNAAGIDTANIDNQLWDAGIMPDSWDSAPAEIDWSGW